jgi:hypothetical protein
MPLDSKFGDNLFNSKCLGWERAFAWLPHRCEISKRIIWMKYAYVGTAIYVNPLTNGLAFEHRWHHKNAHLVWLLKK